MRMTKTTAVLAICLAAATLAEAQTSPALYRVFLSDGSALASFGEWARVGDRVIFSMPLAPGAGPGELHLVSLPAKRVDLDRTERYADAVRATQYAATRGEADFAQLSGAVAQTLNQVSQLTDPKQRLATAEQARRTLADWPGAHFGYRAAEVREVLGVLDDVISGLRAQAGQRGFELALTTNTIAPITEELLAPPNHTEMVEGMVAASRLVESPAERISLLQSVVALIDRAVEYLPASFASAFRAIALGDIAEEQRINGLYERLRSSTLAEATRHAERADVRGLERLRQHVREQDAALGAKRPEDMNGLVATLDAHLDAAHRLRLAHDQWLLAEGRLRAYRSAITPYVQALVDERQSFEDIKLLAGPAPQRLFPLSRTLNRHARFIALIQPPPQLAAVHAAFRSAYSLAESAVQLRRDAIDAASVELARQASAAAAGAVLLLERARQDLKTALEPPVGIAPRP
jgi:hypothetical protein